MRIEASSILCFSAVAIMIELVWSSFDVKKLRSGNVRLARGLGGMADGGIIFELRCEEVEVWECETCERIGWHGGWGYHFFFERCWEVCVE